MSITDELRKYAQGYKNSHDAWSGIGEELDHIADRIDAEHESACAEAYGNGVQSVAMPDLTAYVKLPVDAEGKPIRIGDVMEGVDKYDSLKKVMGKVITVSFETDGLVDVAVQAWNGDGKSWHRAYLDPDASVYHHYHEPTVEDVLREFAHVGIRIAAKHGIEAGEFDFYADEEAIAEFAAKLRLAEWEEQ